jgi:hypothetical protein
MYESKIYPYGFMGVMAGEIFIFVRLPASFDEDNMLSIEIAFYIHPSV